MGSGNEIRHNTLSESDREKYPQAFDAYSRLKTVQDLSLNTVISTFEVSPRIWFVDEDGVELTSANQSSRVRTKAGAFHISSGVTSGNSSTLRGKKHPRCQPNRGWIFQTTGSMIGSAGNGIRQWGVTTEESGLFFELNNGSLFTVYRTSEWQYFTATAGQTTFTFTEAAMPATDGHVYARVRPTGSVQWANVGITSADPVTGEVVLTVPLAAGDTVVILSVTDTKVDVSAQIPGIDISKETHYAVRVQGRVAYEFLINGQSVTEFSNRGVGTNPILSNPALPIYFHAENTGDLVEMHMGCADVATEGGVLTKLEYVSVANSPAIPITVAQANQPDRVLLILHSPNLFEGRHNTRDMDILRVTGSANAKCFINVYVTRNPVWVTTTPIFKSRTDGSAILYDNGLDAADAVATNLAFDRTSGTLIASRRIPIDDSRDIDNPNVDRIEYTMTHGDYIVVTGYLEKTGGATAEMHATFEIGEEI